MTVADRPLAQELATFDAHRSELLAASPGKFALLKRDAIIGVYDSAMDAVAQGYSRFSHSPFLVKRILAVDEEIQITSMWLGPRRG